MRKSASFAFAAFAALSLAGCGKSVDANQSATADTVEVPAEDAMAGATAMPSDAAIMEASEAADGGTDAASDAAVETAP
jgi:hypothetical protein